LIWLKAHIGPATYNRLAQPKPDEPEACLGSGGTGARISGAQRRSPLHSFPPSAQADFVYPSAQADFVSPSAQAGFDLANAGNAAGR
jgi:hypothetical protein